MYDIDSYVAGNSGHMTDYIKQGLRPSIAVQQIFNPNYVKDSYAVVKGGPLAPMLHGVVYFHDVPDGTEVCVNVDGLPPYQPGSQDNPPIGPHGFHIHDKGNCDEGMQSEPFTMAGGHWNPTNQPHGNHAGDFPVLFSNAGKARMCFFTDKFKPRDVVGKSVIIHQNPDDYRSQPAGDSGKRLACGVIQESSRL